MVEKRKKLPSKATPAHTAGGLMAIAVMAITVGCGSVRPTKPGYSLMVPVERSTWTYGDALGQKLQTTHYRIHTTSNNRKLLAHLPGFMENAYDHYGQLTDLGGAAPAGKMTTYVMASRRQWAAMTEAVTGPNSRVYLAIENGGYCYRGICVMWDLGHFSTFAIAAHEGMHQFLYHRLTDTMPAWAEEGMAVLAEGFQLGNNAVLFDPETNPLRQGDLRTALSAGRRLTTEKLLAGDAGDHVARNPARSAEYYGQLWALMLFIRSEPQAQAGLERMLADAAAGKMRRSLSIPPIMGSGRTYTRAIALPVFKHYIDADVGAFEERFRAFARNLAKMSK